MSIVSNLIFHDAKHYVTSKFGYRYPLKTEKGTTNPFHSGTDYGTNGKKLPQYAIEDGEVLTVARANDGALYVWVSYPRLGVKFLHYHLDSIKVKAGQKVDKNTILGYTGKTGKATGIHLHLGVKKLSGGGYIDPEKWAKNEYTAPKTPKYYKKYTGESKSLVDALKSINETSTLAYRKKIAKANGIKAYIGTASQNTKMLNLLKKGKLIKP